MLTQIRPKCLTELSVEVPTVLLMSYPRSGNTFVRQILFEAFGLPSYTAYLDEFHTEEYGGFVEDIENLPEVLFVKTHTPLVIPGGAKVWHIVRDGRDAYTSYRDLRGNGQPADEWGKFVLSVNADATTRYEDLVADPIVEVKVALNTLGYDFPILCDELTPFEELHERAPHFWRVGEVGTWREELPDVEAFEDANREALERYGYV